MVERTRPKSTRVTKYLKAWQDDAVFMVDYQSAHVANSV
jgi:hypothetical protein